MSPTRFKPALRYARNIRAFGALCWALVWTGCAGFAPVASALVVSNYSSAVNDRFASGYDTAPVPNTNSLFVGLGYDWSGVCWSPLGPTYLTQSFGMLSPRHYLVAYHYGSPASVRYFGGNGQVYTAAMQSVRSTGLGPSITGTDGISAPGDVSLGTLTAPVPLSAQITCYPILDLVPPDITGTNPSYSAYYNLNFLMYGWTARIAANKTYTLVSCTYGLGIASTTTLSGYESGDSGSPIFVPWTDFNGVKQLTILGAAWAIGSGYNYDTFLPETPVFRALNGFMANEGYALRWVANASGTWTGATSGKFTTTNNWSPHVTPSDSFALFDGSTATNRSIALNGNQNLRGLIFKNAVGSNSFTLQKGSVLTIGRGGVRNLDADSNQSILCDVALNDAQWWDGGAGGFTVSGAINNNGFLLVFDGTGNTTMSGSMTGVGGLAKEGSGTMTLSGSNAFGGTLFVHRGTLNITGSSGNGFGGATVFGGTLLVNNATGSATGTGPVTVAAGGTLSGTGLIAPSDSNSVTINGILSPGDALTTGTLRLAMASGNLVLTDSATLVLKSGTASDLVQLNSNPVVLGGTLQIVTGTGFSYAQPLTIFSGLSTPPTGTFATVTGLATGYQPTFSTQAANYVATFVPTTYATWQQLHFTPAQIASGQANDTADPDGDGIPNLIEYALGLDSGVPSRTGLPTPALDASGTYLTLTVSRNPYATDLTYLVEVTGDLTIPTSWNTTNTTVLVNTPTTLIVRDNIPIANATRRFMRLQVIRQ